jgi:hypothetical protein
MRSDGSVRWITRAVGSIQRTRFKLSKEDRRHVGRLLRPSLVLPATTPIAGVSKTTRKCTIHIRFASFFHKDLKYGNGFFRILTEMQKRSENVQKSKTQKHDSGQIKQD